MTPLALAWRSLSRQPARAWLGIAGVAIVGALLFDMLLLSGGLVVSFRDLLEGVGFDVRVTANRAFPAPGPRLENTVTVTAILRDLPEVEEVVAVRFGRAKVHDSSGRERRINFMGVGGRARDTWTVLEGADLPQQRGSGEPAILVNRYLAGRLDLFPGSTLSLRGACDRHAAALPATEFRVAGIVSFRFDVAGEATTVTALPDLLAACDLSDRDAVDFLFVASAPGAGPDAAVRAIRHALPDLHTFSNREFVDRVSARDFSYFRQISFALSAITLCFAFLLIATLLTVSVNQRLGEIAALRALGFRRGRVVADLLWESCLLVGTGGLVALPLGGLLAVQLDAILRSMPGIPESLHFFVFHTRAVVLYGLLLTTTGLLAALYPVYLAARLPIAATLRKEVVS